MTRLIPILAAGASLAFAGIAHAADTTPVDGTWQKHEHIFSFAGFTSKYSCDGLEGKLKLLLRTAGARPGFKVLCTNAMGRPERISVARLTFYTLAPADAPPPAPGKDGKPPAPGDPGVGTWRTVELKVGSPRELEGGDCELVEQFAHELLPMFTTRDVVNNMTCVPNEANLFGIRLRFDSLGALPDAKPPQVAATR
jgi:hypothetical protein